MWWPSGSTRNGGAGHRCAFAAFLCDLQCFFNAFHCFPNACQCFVQCFFNAFPCAPRVMWWPSGSTRNGGTGYSCAFAAFDCALTSSPARTQLRLASPRLARSHARTHERNEYDFPVGLTPQPPMYMRTYADAHAHAHLLVL